MFSEGRKGERKIITNWDNFNEWREESLKYHKESSEYRYYNALTFFEYAREYFNKEGFPDERPRGKPTKYNPLGNFRNWTVKESLEQKKEIHEHVKNVQKQRKRRKSV